MDEAIDCRVSSFKLAAVYIHIHIDVYLELHCKMDTAAGVFYTVMIFNSIVVLNIRKKELDGKQCWLIVIDV